MPNRSTSSTGGWRTYDGREQKKSGVIERFLTGTSGRSRPGQNVTLDDLRQPRIAPRSTLMKSISRRRRGPRSVGQLRRARRLRHQGPGRQRAHSINPLGLTITCFREDQAFVAEPAVRP